jgi:hypothetical protein
MTHLESFLNLNSTLLLLPRTGDAWYMVITIIFDRDMGGSDLPAALIALS